MKQILTPKLKQNEHADLNI